MRDVLKACVVCFTMDAKLLSMDNNSLRQQYNLLTGLQLKKGNGMPEYLCYQCCGYMSRFIKFRDKCHRAYFVLDQLLQKDNEIKKTRLKALDCDSICIKPCLSYLNVEKAHYEQLKFKWVKIKRDICLNRDEIPIVTYTTLTKEQMFQDIAKLNGNLIKYEDEQTAMIEIDMRNEINVQTSSFDVDNTETFDGNDNDNYDSDDNENVTLTDKTTDKTVIKCEEADGSVLDTEYATMHAISRNEAQAALEISKTIGFGKFICTVCDRRFKNEDRLKTHSRMHDKHVSGSFFCELCTYYYKSSFLLKSHMTEKHMYKYLCKKCPEVNFDRKTAKQHYLLAHLQKRTTTDEAWELARPSWLMAKGGKRTKGVSAAHPKLKKRKPSKLPLELVYAPISQEEQYALIQDRKNSRNYIEAPYKCGLCFKGYREQDTFSKHMKKHDQTISGEFQCDMCKLYFKDARKMYKHMTISHIAKFSCQLCSFVCYNRGQAVTHYRFHNNVTYKCPHCPLEFKKLSTRLTHVRIKHPSSFICNLCGHSFVSDTGLYCHKQIAHTLEEVEESSQVPVDKSSSLYCADCDILFVSDAAFDTHLGSSKKHATVNLSIASSVRERARVARNQGRCKSVSKSRGRPRRHGASSEVLNNGIATSTSCEICNKFLVNDTQARKHYSTEHPGKEYLKRYMCDVCGHTTKQYANLIVHMRTHTNEKPYQCPHCDRRFSMPSNRDRHIVVHTGEKRYQCHQCHRRFTQSSAVKLHIQTVHLKIPYAPWDKKNRKRRKELEGTSAPIAAVNINLPPQPKIILDQDYLNAYINYNDE